MEEVLQSNKDTGSGKELRKSDHTDHEHGMEMKAKFKNSKTKEKVSKLTKASKIAKVSKPKRDPRIEEIYEEEVTFDCPVRGKVKQKVKIKRFKPLTEQDGKHLVVSVSELAEKLDEKDDGLSIYNDGEELGISTSPSEEAE